MPEHILKWVGRHNVVGVEKHIIAPTAQLVVKLNGRRTRLDAPIADKRSPLTA